MQHHLVLELYYTPHCFNRTKRTIYLAAGWEEEAGTPDTAGHDFLHQ